MFGRYGGEEFIAVLPGRDGAEARAVGERMRTAVENAEVRHEGQRVRLTVRTPSGASGKSAYSRSAAIKPRTASPRNSRRWLSAVPGLLILNDGVVSASSRSAPFLNEYPNISMSCNGWCRRRDSNPYGRLPPSGF